MPQMSRFQSKSTYHAKNQEDLKLNEERQPTDANAEMTGILSITRHKNLKQSSMRNSEHTPEDLSKETKLQRRTKGKF